MIRKELDIALGSIFQKNGLVYTESAKKFLRKLMDYVDLQSNNVPDAVAEMLDRIEEINEETTEMVVYIQSLKDYVEQQSAIIEEQSLDITEKSEEVTQNTLDSKTYRDETKAYSEIAASIVSGGPRGVYDNLAALNAANPSHTYLYVTKNNGFWNYWDDNIGAFVGGGIYQTFSTEETTKNEYFLEVPPVGDTFNINYFATPFATITLNGNYSFFYININGAVDGNKGKILVFQTGEKNIVLGNNIQGSAKIATTSGSITILEYNVIGETIYLYSKDILGDDRFPIPQKINTLILTFSDSNTASLKWLAPYANNLLDSASYYDIRYSNVLIDPENPVQWLTCKKITENVPIPAYPGEEETFTITGLAPGKEYYFYIKSVRVNYGIKQISESSNFVYCKTLGATDLSKPYRITLTKENIFPILSMYSEGALYKDFGEQKMVDEQEKNIFLETGYPDTSVVPYNTQHHPITWSRKTKPYYIMIDLFQQYDLDKFFLCSNGVFTSTIYAAKDFGYNWEEIGTMTNNKWNTLNFENGRYRFLLLVQDACTFTPIIEDDTTGVIGNIQNIILYGRSVLNIPDGIKTPLRRVNNLKTVDEFCCTVGWQYESPILHSLISGPFVRLYNNFSRFFDDSNSWIPLYFEKCKLYERLADWKFNVGTQSWIINNTDNTLDESHIVTGDILMNKYKELGLKPFICQVSFADAFQYYRYQLVSGTYRRLNSSGNDSTKINKMLDGYWKPLAWKPVWKSGTKGFTDFFLESRNPANYKLLSKLQFNIAARYGSNNTLLASDLSLVNTIKDGGYIESRNIGLDNCCGIEPGNEMDGASPRSALYDPFEAAALISAVTDGHCNSFTDEDGGTNFGIKKADNNMLVIAPGCARNDPGYMYAYLRELTAIRPDNNIPFDVINIHQYFPNYFLTGERDDFWKIPASSISCERLNETADDLTVKRLLEIRDRFAPTKEFWITEYGWGEAGTRSESAKCKFQVRSLPGRIVGNVLIPDRHRSEVKGAYIVRANIYYMSIGVNLTNYYAIASEGNFFAVNQYDQGAGFEMFIWNTLVDMTPGAKYNAIALSEVPYERNNFDTLGLFGNQQNNGYYPITNAFWWFSTFRNTLKGYVFIGFKKSEVSDLIKIACFRKVGENKGAYVVYLNSEINNAFIGQELLFPESVITTKKVTTYLPKLPNPNNIPASERQNPGPQYYPIVGPVGLWDSDINAYLTANKRKVWNVDHWEVQNYNQGIWEQANALADYIQNNPEGVKGSHGISQDLDVVGNKLIINVTEFPEYYLFDAVPEPDFESFVENVSSRTEGTNSVTLFWNDTNPEDTGYEIFYSTLADSEYTLLKTVSKGVENKTLVTGLLPNTTYYFKIRPVRNSKPGTLSDYTSAKTDVMVLPVNNLTSSGKTSSSIDLNWEYPVVDEKFDYFGIYKADLNGEFNLAGIVSDPTITSYTVGELISGNTYSFKVLVYTTEGKSIDSNIVTLRTYLPEEVSPVYSYGLTDRVGVEIKAIFDLNLAEIPVDFVASNFTILENGIQKPFISVQRDSDNINTLLFTIAEGTLKNYTDLALVTLSYNAPEINFIESAYGIKLESFSNKLIKVFIGNYTNIVNTYKINFADVTDTPPTSIGWNQFAANKTLNQPGATPNISLTNIVDELGVVSNIGIQALHITTSSPYKWGISVPFSANAICTIPNIEEVVYRTKWELYYFCLETENVVGRFIVTGLDSLHKYKVKVFSSAIWGTAVPVRMKINGIYSNTVNQLNNSNTYITIDECEPSPEGLLNIDMIRVMPTVDGGKAYVNYMIIEEYSV